MEKLIQLDTYPVNEVLDILLTDRTTGKNIIWATRSYEEFGEEYTDKYVIEKKAILEKPELIQPRVAKSLEAQQARTKAKAEVFTPSWICNKMNNYVDEMDGLTDCVQIGIPEELPIPELNGQQTILDFDPELVDPLKAERDKERAPLCLIKNWRVGRNGASVEFALSKQGK